jgi:hypothetical protein
MRPKNSRSVSAEMIAMSTSAPEVRKNHSVTAIILQRATVLRMRLIKRGTGSCALRVVSGAI